jgi:hypothetical protein
MNWSNDFPNSFPMRTCVILILITTIIRVNAQNKEEQKQVLKLTEDFFAALEKQDTTAFRNMFVDNGYLYAVREMTDSVMVRSQLPDTFRFRAGQILKERMRNASTTVKIEGRIAMVWAPYDLWINDTFSHCGVDVFTWIKTSKGWKIASIAYTMQTEACK